MGKTGSNAARREMPIELKGKKYTVRELDLDAYGEIENFVRAKYARLFRQSAIGMKPKDVNTEVMKIIRLRFTPEELGEEMSAADCIAFVGYLAIRHNPGITLENVYDILDQSNLGEVSDLVDAMSGEDAPDDEAEDDDVNPPKADKKSS